MAELAQRYRTIVEETLRIEKEESERRGNDRHSKSKPRSPASEEAIAKAEKKREKPFHESYKTFLRAFNGWEHFAWGLSLFGTDEIFGEEYEDDWEVFTYGDEPLPDELEAGLLIGSSEDGADRVLLLPSGEVVEWMYEEESRHPDLATYLETRKTTLLEMRADAIVHAKRTEAEWDPKLRQKEDKDVEVELRKALAETAKAKTPRTHSAPPKVTKPAPKAVDPADLVVKKGKEVVAYVGLGVVLYLGAAPTKDEVLATWRAFRRRFPVKGKLEWRLASTMAFSNEESSDPDSEPFAEKLKVDDEGHFGIRAEIEARGKNGGTWLLNVRGVPAEELDDEVDEDEDEDEREPVLVPRASFVELMVPPHVDPKAVEAFCHDLVDILPVRSGHGGWFAQVLDEDAEPDPYATVLAWCRRFLAIEVGYVDGWLSATRRRHRGAGWLTVLGTPFVRALGKPLLSKLSKPIVRHDGKNGIVLRAGPTPTLGDVARGGFPEAIAEVARMLEPVTITDYAKHGAFSVGGVWFSTSTDELPGAFADHHATHDHLRRFVDPMALIGPTPREKAIELAEKLFTENKKKPKDWTTTKKTGGFGDVLRELYNATTTMTTTPLAIEALELAARYPDWAPPSVYNNLLYAYLHTNDTAKGMALMPSALRTAKDNVETYHNAACILVRAKKLDEALNCVKMAKAGGYKHFAKIQVDEDLAPLTKKKAFQELFADLPKE